MRRILTILTMLIALGVVVQFFLAASAAFDTSPKDEAFDMHRILGYAIMLAALLTTLVAALARVPGRLTGQLGLIAGLVFAQGLIAMVANAFGDSDTSTTTGQLVFGLHALNGLAIMGLAGNVLQQARAELKPTAAPRERAEGEESPASPHGPAQPAS